MRLNNILIAVSFVWLLVSFWNRDDLPARIDYVPEIADEPQQTRTSKQPFQVSYEAVDYLVEPEFAYELTGMIVSYRHHDYKSRLHRLANDHLNMLDVCVVWGDNTIGDHVYKIDFWNGIFTCNFQTLDQEAWDAFNGNQLSNNHLISDDEYIRKRVRDIQIGDQIHIRGFLAAYSNPKSGRRGTSTTRTDTGDGACETIYVESFRIVQSATSYWRISMVASLLLLVTGLVIHFKRPYRPY